MSMKLQRLVDVLESPVVEGDVSREIASLCYDSRQAGRDSLFIALRGERSDGHAHIEEAVERGATAVLCERDACAAPRATMVRVACTRRAMADVAVAFHRNPSCKLKTAGVTGTNGKTTTAFLLKHILQAETKRSALIGTVRYEIGDRVLPAARTTPESVDLQRLLDEAQRAGCRSVVMEASSHALALERVRGVEFDVGVFTNLSQDHLDFHRTMDEYFAAKERLFSAMAGQKRKKGRAVVNIDDRHGRKLAGKLEGKLETRTFGLGVKAGYRAAGVRALPGGTTFELEAGGGRKYLVRFPLIGRFNVYNALAALAAADAMGVDLRAAVKALSTAPQVPGRLEAVEAKRNFRIFVDYAHTPDALENAVRTLRDLDPGRLIVVFGCGGDRDRAKRAPMAAAVEGGADVVIVTSDNPRGEEPEAIIEDILKGFRLLRPMVVPDRREAIYQAVELARDRDIVLIAGKGHENYQEVGGQKFPFSDVEVAGWALEEKPANYMRENQAGKWSG